MRKVNFNNLENLEIPQHWTEKALNLPSQLPQKKNIFALPSFYYRLSFVACCVLACALAVAIFGFMKNDILPQKTPAESITHSTTNSTSSDTATVHSGITQKPTSVKPTQNIEPTEEPTENSTQSESDNSSTQTQEPTVRPTQKATSSKPTTPQKPTQVPTEVVTTVPEDTPDPPAWENYDMCVGYIDESLLCGSSTVYCLVIPTNSDISLPEAPDTYIANVNYTGNGSVRISFAGKDSPYVDHSDYYTFYFYNENGDIIYQDTIYVTVR